MIRVKTKNISTRRKKKYLKIVRGYRNPKAKVSIVSIEQVRQSYHFAYVARKLRKRHYRKIWICRMNAQLKTKKSNYSTFMGSLRKQNIFLNRKILSSLAYNQFSIFNAIFRYCKNV